MKNIRFILLILTSFNLFAQGNLTEKDTLVEITTFVDVEASFPGGNLAMKKYIMNTVIYPQQALDSLQKGKVYIEFIILTDGSIQNVKCIRSISPLLDEESIRVIKSMPNWIPAEVKGIPVNTKNYIPIVYQFR